MVVEPPVEGGERPCDNQSMTKAELRELVDRLTPICWQSPLPKWQGSVHHRSWPCCSRLRREV